jgi:hypothetical protein
MRIAETGDGQHVTTSWKRLALALLAAASLVIGFVSAEITLIGPVLFLVHWLGFWSGLAVFTSSCVLFGVMMLWVTVRFWPERATRASPDVLSTGPVRRVIRTVARRSRPLGALGVAWYCGPFASPPILRALGYQGRGLVIWVLVSGVLFGAFWYSFYGGGFTLLTSMWS